MKRKLIYSAGSADAAGQPDFRANARGGGGGDAI